MARKSKRAHAHAEVAAFAHECVARVEAMNHGGRLSGTAQSICEDAGSSLSNGGMLRQNCLSSGKQGYDSTDPMLHRIVGMEEARR